MRMGLGLAHASFGIVSAAERLLLVSKRLHGVHSCGTVCWVEAEAESDRDADGACQQSTPHRNPRMQAQAIFEELAGGKTEHDTKEPTDECESCSLHEKLPQDFTPGGTKRLPQSDLLGSIRHGHHHNGHHSNATHQEGNTGERDHRHEEIRGEVPYHLENLILCDHIEGVGYTRTKVAYLPQCNGDEILRFRN